VFGFLTIPVSNAVAHGFVAVFLEGRVSSRFAAVKHIRDGRVYMPLKLAHVPFLSPSIDEA
jgi:hypothetical protein